MKKIIISLGGSLIYPKKRDYAFLKRFKEVIHKEDYQFVIFCGGGYLARKWQKIGSFLRLNKHILDWIGILATWRNAHKVKEILNGSVRKKIIINPTQKIDFKEKILVAAGWKPGWSTDYDAVLLAKNLGIGEIINMSNITYVHDKDPNKHKDAKPINSISWNDFKKIVGDEWKPGLNMPFDPIASKEAAKLGIKVIIIGNNLVNLKRLLDGKQFKGTTIT